MGMQAAQKNMKVFTHFLQNENILSLIRDAYKHIYICIM